MSSSLSWLDFSEHERRKMVEVVDSMHESDTRDELGLGTIRDAFADLLFPGTSTIQTRARYFLFIPWIYLGLERRQATQEFGERARQAEIGLMNALDRGGERQGVIGIVARQTLARLPSNVYWTGLSRWGIRLTPWSQAQHHRAMDAAARSPAARDVRSDDGTVIESARRNWHAALPPAPDGFPTAPIGLSLTRHEAQYLRERVITSAPRSLLAFLLREARPVADDVKFAWDSSDYATFPAPLQRQLDHARRFSLVMQGATLLYNLLLAEAATNASLRDSYTADLVTWAASLRQEELNLRAWNPDQLWVIVCSEGARIPPPARLFSERWVERALRPGHLGEVADDPTARTLVANRERQLKGGQARLVNPRALDMWNGAAGTGRLSYRWPVAHRMLRDILGALAPESDPADA